MELSYGKFICLLASIVVMIVTIHNSTLSKSEAVENALQQAEGKSVGHRSGPDVVTENINKDNLLNKLNDYELVVPVYVDSKGNFLGYELARNHDTQTIKKRLKRSSISTASVGNGNTNNLRTSDNSKHSVERHPIKSQKLETRVLPNNSNNSSRQLSNLHNYEKDFRIYYNITAFNKVFHLKLSPSKNLLSPLYRVEQYRKGGKENGTAFHKKSSTHHHCHYHGHISNAGSTSFVAVSNCNGLFGVLSVQGERYFIEPLGKSTPQISQFSRNNKTISDIGGQVHVIFKESSVKTIHNHSDHYQCGNTDLHKVNNITFPFWWQLPKLSSEIINTHTKTYNSNSGRQKWTKRKRRKRSVSEEKYVETLVVADKKMVDYHGNDQIEPFVLSVMNVVSKLYHDASIGNSINIVVTRLVLLLEEQEELSVGFHADQALQSFCKWQQKINPDENSQDVLVNGIAHHDNAILLTRYDICSNRDEPCGTLGLAPVAGMCDPTRSCSIVEDIGLATAFTVAHELGHNFGMQHDGAGNDCGMPGGRAAKLMASQLTQDTNPFQWSACSKEYITAFLDSGRGKCLDNEPPHMDFEYPDDMPGQHHSPDTQCQWQYGSHSVMCKPHLLCRELYCINPAGECITNSIPAADGTPCSYNNHLSGWCLQGDCVGKGYTAKEVDGEWNAWSRWGQCSRTCGGGVESSHRRCDNPKPKHGGKFCTGERKRYRSCNIHDCPPGSRDFRTIQCAKFDAIPFRGKFYKWKPYSGAIHHKPCALNCLAEGFNFYTERAPKVVDGTPCYPDSLDVCINGECMVNKVGCDRILGSDSKEDKCRVCSGDGSSCTTIKGFFSKPFANITDTYREVMIIPKNAVNIHIKETTASRNYIAIKTAHDNVYYINGHWTIDWPRKVQIAGTAFHYKRPDGKPENIFALGPISEDIVIMLLLQEDNLGIQYEYNLPIPSQQENVIEFGWKYMPWTPCSTSCATGKSISEAACVRQSNGSPVADSVCQKFAKPELQAKKCNTHPCDPEWRVGEWSSCSKTCNSGMKTRSVMCVQKKDALEEDIIEQKLCTKKKPRSETNCQKDECPPTWVAMDEWSKCKPACGPGTQSRNVYCVSPDGHYQPDYKCDKSAKPSHKRQCSNRECIKSMWISQGWEECNVDCGRGLQKRDVSCVSESGNSSHDCDTWDRPYSVRECVGQCKPKSDEECLDREKVTYCPLVIQFKFCSRAYFHHMCCRTCRDAGFKLSGF